MKIYNVTEQQLQNVAKAVNMTLNDCETRGVKVPHVKVTIRPLPGCVHRVISPSTGRKVNAVDYAGHAAFFCELFKVAPNARIVSVLGEFTGAEELVNLMPGFASRNVGSSAAPITALNACTIESQNVYKEVFKQLRMMF